MNTATQTMHELRSDVLRREAMIEELTPTFNESTGATWLWSALFGWIYFLAHGMWTNVLLHFVLTIVIWFGVAVILGLNDAEMIVGPSLMLSAFPMLVIDPILAYAEWKRRAVKKATNMIVLRG